MSDQQPGKPEPTRRQKLKPFEYLLFAAASGVFIGVIVLMTVREPITALIFGGVAFIATLLLIATLMLTVKPRGRSSADLDKREGFEP